ncbi:MAG: outer membrane protein assembly factor BamD [Bacteroidales bacterium]
MKKLALLLMASAFIFTGCQYEKLLKSRNYQLKYDKALEYYEEGDYTRADGLFEQLKPVMRPAAQGDTVHFYSAYANYYNRNYQLAGHYFEEFHEIYGNSSFAEEAEFMAAYCSYKLSPRPSLDQGYTKKAINDFTLYLSRHPQTERRTQVLTLINELKDKLVEKSYMGAELYYKLEDYKASIIALNNSLEQFPQTQYREEIIYMLVRSRFLYAENSVEDKQKERYQETIDEYITFVNEFPESEYLSEVKEYYNKANGVLQN